MYIYPYFHNPGEKIATLLGEIYNVMYTFHKGIKGFTLMSVITVMSMYP